MTLTPIAADLDRNQLYRKDFFDDSEETLETFEQFAMLSGRFIQDLIDNQEELPPYQLEKLVFLDAACGAMYAQVMNLSKKHTEDVYLGESFSLEYLMLNNVSRQCVEIVQQCWSLYTKYARLIAN